jgi:hypothetical protein
MPRVWEYVAALRSLVAHIRASGTDRATSEAKAPRPHKGLCHLESPKRHLGLTWGHSDSSQARLLRYVRRGGLT